MVAYTRQTSNLTTFSSPYHFPAALLDKLKSIILERVKFVDKAEKDNTLAVFEKRVRQWKDWQPTQWERDYFNPSLTDYPLLRQAGDYAIDDWKRISWATPMSMRNVDAGCQAAITNLYLEGDAQND